MAVVCNGNTQNTLVNSLATGFGDAFMYLFIFSFAPSSVLFFLFRRHNFFGTFFISPSFRATSRVRSSAARCVCESRYRDSGGAVKAFFLFRFASAFIHRTGRMNKRWGTRAWRRRCRDDETHQAKEIKEIKKKNLLHQVYGVKFFSCAFSDSMDVKVTER